MAGLNRVIWTFQKNLIAACSTTNVIITREEIKTIFSNIDVISNFNGVLLSGLEERLKVSTVMYPH